MFGEIWGNNQPIVPTSADNAFRRFKPHCEDSLFNQLLFEFKQGNSLEGRMCKVGPPSYELVYKPHYTEALNALAIVKNTTNPRIHQVICTSLADHKPGKIAELPG